MSTSKNCSPDDDSPSASSRSANSVRRPRLSRRKKLLFSAAACIGFFAVVELLLTLVGVRPLLYEEDPYVGFESRAPLFVESEDDDGQTQMVTAENKRRFFNDQSFPKRKDDGVTRIFCLGGSTTFGRPYDDATSYCGWLREMLPEADPSRQWQLVNAGGISYASYRVAVVMEELSDYEPDLFIVYTGHNEFLERRTYADIIDMPAPIRGLSVLLGHTRTYSTIQRMLKPRPRKDDGRSDVLPSEVNTILDQSVGPQEYRRDEEFSAQVLAHYRYNLARMVEIARVAGAKLIFITPASNLRHCSPFKSQHRSGLSETDVSRCDELLDEATETLQQDRPDEALAKVNEALAIDDQHAALHYLHGRVLDALDRHEEAKRAYEAARDNDICPLRALTTMRAILREVAAERDVPVLDFAALAEQESPQGIPGENLFLDHVHPTVRGHRRLALKLVDVLAEQDFIELSDSWGEEAIAKITTRIEKDIDHTRQGKAMRNLAQVMLWAGKTDDAYRAAKQAVELAPGDGEAHYLLAKLAEDRGERDVATEHYKILVDYNLKADPPPVFYVNAVFRYAGLLAAAGQLDESITYLEKTLALDRRHPTARERLVETLAARGETLIRSGRSKEAETRFRRLVELRPRNVDAINKLAVALMQSNRSADAVEQLNIAIDVDPSFPRSHANLGVALIQLERYDEAEQALRRALELNPDYQQARKNLQLLMQGKGRP